MRRAEEVPRLLLMIAKLPGFRSLSEINPVILEQPNRTISVTLWFLFAPQLLALAVFLVSKHGKSLTQVIPDLFALVKTQFGHGELFLYSIASLAPVFVVLTRERSLRQRTALAFYFIFSAVVSAALLMAEQPGNKISGVPYFFASVLVFLLTAIVVYIANILDTDDPAAEAARLYERPSAESVDDLRREVDDMLRSDGEDQA